MMKEKRITLFELAHYDKSTYDMNEMLIDNKCWRLLGAMWKKRIEVFEDIKTGDLVMRYK